MGVVLKGHKAAGLRGTEEQEQTMEGAARRIGWLHPSAPDKQAARRIIYKGNFDYAYPLQAVSQVGKPARAWKVVGPLIYVRLQINLSLRGNSAGSMASPSTLTPEPMRPFR
jgi:hypothetical protein